MSAFIRDIGKSSLIVPVSLASRFARRRVGGKLFRNIGPFRAASAVAATPDATISHTATVNDGSDLSIYTFLSTAIGTAAANRTILVGIASNAVDVSTVLLDATSMSSVVALGGANRRCSLWQADFASGTTASLVITFASGAQDCGVDVWAAYGIGLTNDTQTSTANPMSATLSIPAGGVAVGIATNFSAAATFTWGEMTEDSDQVIAGSGNISYTASSRASASAISPTVTCTPSGASNERMALASFSPG